MILLDLRQSLDSFPALIEFLLFIFAIDCFAGGGSGAAATFVCRLDRFCAVLLEKERRNLEDELGCALHELFSDDFLAFTR